MKVYEWIIVSEDTQGPPQMPTTSTSGQPTDSVGSAKQRILCMGSEGKYPTKGLPAIPPNGEEKACTNARLRVRYPSWVGVAVKAFPISLYTAGKICSSMRSITLARFSSTVVHSLHIITTPSSRIVHCQNQFGMVLSKLINFSRTALLSEVQMGIYLLCVKAFGKGRQGNAHQAARKGLQRKLVSFSSRFEAPPPFPHPLPSICKRAMW